ncbi:MAG: hypothetical protein B6I34_05520 [Anaerolineaceae bacterium 4572_32.1]|nr:MAG: hypothetical protein B6I34_05520 [Anaerolineaceae bacterium 4572_32.1]
MNEGCQTSGKRKMNSERVKGKDELTANAFQEVIEMLFPRLEEQVDLSGYVDYTVARRQRGPVARDVSSDLRDRLKTIKKLSNLRGAVHVLIAVYDHVVLRQIFRRGRK